MEISPYKIDETVYLRTGEYGIIKCYQYLYHLDMFIYEILIDGYMSYRYETEIMSHENKS